jgi:hypothetical protein
MSLATSDIHGTTGAKFTITIDAATIVKAFLEAGSQPKVALTVGASGREVTVPSLPAGDSIVRLDLVWAPGDTDATIDVGTVTTGTVKAAAAKGIITAGDTPGVVELFGA